MAKSFLKSFVRRFRRLTQIFYCSISILFQNENRPFTTFVASPYGLSLVVKAPLGTRPKESEAGVYDSNECNEWPTSSIQ